MSTPSNWRDVLSAQYADLARLEAMDRGLDERAISADIDSVLKRPVGSKIPVAHGAARTTAAASVSGRQSAANEHHGDHDNADENDYEEEEEVKPRRATVSSSARPLSGSSATQRRSSSESHLQTRAMPSGLSNIQVSDDTNVPQPGSARSKEDSIELPKAPETQAR